ncbi:MAG: trigger factor [candidate division Zixibacteria bacterium]|nr:trigger factor [candidate division Zixibacteria bacterium]
MKVELKEGEGLKRELTIEIAAEQVNGEIERQLEEKRREAALKGFRKGKAPMNMIREIYGDAVKIDVVDKVINDSLPEAVREKELKIASRPEVSNLDFTDDGGLKYTATLEVFPEIGEITRDGLELTVEEIDVSDEEVDELVEAKRRETAEVAVVDRPAGPTDIVVADLTKLSDSKGALESDKFPNSHIDLGNNLTVKEFKEVLPGVKPGDVREVTVQYVENYSDPRFAGTEIVYSCDIKSINEWKMPEFNDAFAKNTGVAETALEYRLKLREHIKVQKEEMQRRIHKREVVRQLTEKNPIPIPEGMLEDYLNAVIEDNKKQGQEFDEKELREKYRPMGIDIMRWDMIWHTIAETERIEVLPDDTETWINGLAAQNNMTLDQARDALNKSGKIGELRESIREGKVFEMLIASANKVPAKK